MDKIHDLASKITGGNKGQEYVDKGLNAAEKKIGGDKVDSSKLQGANQKISSAGREQLEKATGYDFETFTGAKASANFIYRKF
ncbi:unnamed protein product [Penicillium glandicola]